MNISMINSLVGMQALQKKIDSISNNIANLETTGYKSREIFFEDILSSRLTQSQDFILDGRLTSAGLDEGTGSRVSLTLADFSQGQQIETGIATDLMLTGEDIFFTVVPPDKDFGEVREHRYTRNGHFQLDANSQLVTDQGDFLLNTNDEPIIIPEGATFSIDKQGRVTAEYPDGQTEDLGMIKLTRIISPQVLLEVGNSQYQIPDEWMTGNFPVSVIDQGFDMEEETYSELYKVIQGSLEGANTDLLKEMTQLNEVQRTYQFQSRGLSIADQMMGMTNNLKG